MQQKRANGYKAARRDLMKAHKQRKRQANVLAIQFYNNNETARRIHNLRMQIIAQKPRWNRWWHYSKYMIRLKWLSVMRLVKKARG